MEQLVINIKDIGDIKVDKEFLDEIIRDFIDTGNYHEILRQIELINREYGNSWSQDGVFINLGDIKDKLTRLEIIVNNGQLSQHQTTLDNYGNVIFDLWVRCLLLMLLDDRIKRYVRNKYNIELG